MMKKIFVFSVLMMALASIGTAQVTFTVVVDVNGPVAGGNAYANAYVPTADKFVSYNSANFNIQVHNAVTGALEGTLNNGVASPSGLGYFGIAAGSDGVIYAVDVGSGGLYRWASTAAAATLAATPAAFARNGHVLGTGVNTEVYFAGSANSGPIEKYTTTDGLNFALAEVIGATYARAKAGFAINQSGTAVWAVGDTGTGSYVQKGIKSATGWIAEDTNFTANADGAAAGPMCYDDTRNIVFAQPMSALSAFNNTVVAIQGYTGATLGSQALTAANDVTAGYSGAYCDPSISTIWTASRGPASNAHYAKLTYVDASNVDDWTLY